jgi:hypothetical protein
MESPSDETQLQDTARAIRAYLPGLVPEDLASALDRELADLLELARQGHLVGDRVAATLEQSPATLAWSGAFLEHGVPPEFVVLPERAYQGLPGAPVATPPDKYRCPEGDFVFYRRTAAVPLPVCPTHRAPLER